MRSKFHSKVNVAMALLSVMAVYCPSMPTFAEESKATTGKSSGLAVPSESKKKATKAVIDKASLPQKSKKESRSKDTELSNKFKQVVDSIVSGKPGVTKIKVAPASKSDDGATADSKFTVLDTSKQQGLFDLKEQEIFENPSLSQNEAINHFENARFYMSKWDTELAEVELRAAIMYMPDMKVAHRDYCLVAMMRGKPLRSLAEFMMVVGLGKAIPLNEIKKRNLREEASGLHYNKGLSYAEESNWKEAITELLWSKKYTPLDPAVHRSLAFAYASNKQFDKAEEQYKYTLSLNPSDALTHADYAVMLSNKGDSAQAMQLMSQAVKLKPDAAALHVDLGWMAESKGDLKTAAKEFRAAANAIPKQTALWVHLGNVLTKLNKNDEAKSAYNKALAINSDNEEAKAGIAALGQSSPKAGVIFSQARSDRDNKDSTLGETKFSDRNSKFTPLPKK